MKQFYQTATASFLIETGNHPQTGENGFEILTVKARDGDALTRAIDQAQRLQWSLHTSDPETNQVAVLFRSRS